MCQVGKLFGMHSQDATWDQPVKRLRAEKRCDDPKNLSAAITVSDQHE
jgi:hypothetical protein